MFLDIHDLKLRKIDFQERWLPGRLELGRGISQVEPLLVEGEAELLAGEIHLSGSLRTAVEVACDRCLEPTRHEVEVEFDLYYRPVKTIAKNEEVEITPKDLDVGFYAGNGLLLEDVVKEQILLTLPMKNICREDCSGLCPQCGKNRNLGDCGCRPASRPAANDLRAALLEKLEQ